MGAGGGWLGSWERVDGLGLGFGVWERILLQWEFGAGGRGWSEIQDRSPL